MTAVFFEVTPYLASWPRGAAEDRPTTDGGASLTKQGRCSTALVALAWPLRLYATLLISLPHFVEAVRSLAQHLYFPQLLMMLTTAVNGRAR